MKLKTLFILLIITTLISSCRKEETEFIETPEDEILEANSNLSRLIERVTFNDGSLDNIVDRASCFNVAFPYTIVVNGSEITVNSIDDYAVIECIFDASDSDTDTLSINFPITIITTDFSEIQINNLNELNSYTNTCNGENEIDDDIECIDFNYPIEAPVFNTNNELLETHILENDKVFFEFLQNINEATIVTLDFPIITTLADNSEISIANFTELETTITNAINSCDEDDDYNYSDDDCNDCTISTVQDVLVNCTDWQVNRLKRNATDYDNAYNGYDFNFFNDGTLSVYWNTTTVYGTWIASGVGNNLEIIIDVPALPLCNNNWILQEIKNCSNDTEINLIVGDNDRLQYYNNCN